MQTLTLGDQQVGAIGLGLMTFDQSGTQPREQLLHTVRAALVAGAPSWWKTYEKVVPEFNSVGFVLGWDGKKWQRAGGTGARGGFDSLTFYLDSTERLGEQLARWGSEGKSGYSGSGKAAADRVIKAGSKVTASQLKALGPGINAKHLSAATKAAKAFAGKGKH